MIESQVDSINGISNVPWMTTALQQQCASVNSAAAVQNSQLHFS